jgi:hypothetical protein
VLDRDPDFSRYKVLILPDSHRFDQDLLRKVRSYLAGGKLILSHESGLDVEGKQFVMEEMGVEYLGPSPYQGDYGDYFEVQNGVSEDIDRMVQFTYVPGSMVKAGPQSTELARIWKAYFDRTYEHFSSHHQTPFDRPTDQAAVVERGSILYILFPVFESYADNAYRIHKLLVRNCLRRLLPQPLRQQ